MIELYVFPPSQRAFKVMAVANYLGIEPTLHALDLTKGDQKSPEYAALNPNMLMPTLKDGDYVLWESNAVMQYLASKRPESGLLPSDERGRLDVTRWTILGPRALGSYLRGISVRKHRQIPRAQKRRARRGGDYQSHRVVPSRRASLGWTAHRQKLC